MLRAMRHSCTLLIALGMAVFTAPGLAQGSADSTVPTQKLTAQETREVALDRLFASLHKASDEQAAKGVEEKIWELWSRFDSPTAAEGSARLVTGLRFEGRAERHDIRERLNRS